MSADPGNCDVIVVGAGPVGATAALLLGSYGVTTTVVERRVEPQRHPAAHVLSTRSLEIWREIGLEREIRRRSAPLSELRTILYCTTVAGRELGRVPLMDLPPERLDAIESVSPTRAVHLPQSELEELLWAQLEESDRIDFHPGWSYESHATDGDGVAVTVADLRTGQRRTLRAGYLIGADGAASAVRTALGVAMVGPVLQHMISVHFSAELERFRRNRRGPVIWTHTPRGVGTIIVHRPPDDLVFQTPYFPPVQSLLDFTARMCRRRILEAIGDRSVSVEVKSVRSWAMTAQVAATYRSGRVFLAGDAAHRFPPTGGLGLNAGIADVHNLAWKLAWVRAGRADAALLDSYEPERRPTAVQATSDAVANFDGLLDVLAALGISRRAARHLPALAARLPGWLPRRALGAVLAGVSVLGFQRLRLASAPGLIGRRVRRRARAAIARQGPHYHSWGRDLGVCYREGAVIAERSAEPESDPQFYTPRLRAGARLPHTWILDNGHRLSTLDLLSRDQLTLLVGTAQRALWQAAAAHLPVRLRTIDDSAFWSGEANDAHADAVVVRPDGHVVALLWAAGDSGAQLRAALAAVSVPVPVAQGRTA